LLCASNDGPSPKAQLVWDKIETVITTLYPASAAS
jgi:hypothetical protein